MPWPFSRKKEHAPADTRSGPQAPRAAGADQALVVEILTWFTEQLPTATARQEGDQAAVLIGAPPSMGRIRGEPGPPAGAVLKVKRGKLSWVDLYDPGLRGPVNDLIRYLDRQQKWSFNGVVSTRYDEAAERT